jgi:hypothetical protein
MTKVMLIFLFTSIYKIYDAALFLQSGIIPPELIEKLSVIGLLSAAIYYLHKENEKNKTDSKERQARYEAQFSSFQDRLFSVEKESLLTIKEFQIVMSKIASTLDEIKEDLQQFTIPKTK